MPKRDPSPEHRALHLINLAERARALGHAIEADYLLLRAWTAFDDSAHSARPTRGEHPHSRPAAG